MAHPLAVRLRQLAEALPEGATVALNRDQILAMIEEAGEGTGAGTGAGKPIEPDLTLAEVGELYGRAPNTVRGWIKTRGLRAYRDATGQWRITRAALEEWQEAQREGEEGPAKREGGKGAAVDLGAWRAHYRRAS